MQNHVNNICCSLLHNQILKTIQTIHVRGVLLSLFCSEAQRSKYVEQRTMNPSLRVRSDVNLGPRITVDATNQTRTTLEKPEEFFVDLETYMEDNPGVTVAESDKVHELIDGKWTEGESHSMKLGTYSFVYLPYVFLCVRF